MMTSEEELEAFFDKLITQLDVLQQFFLASQERIIKLEHRLGALESMAHELAHAHVQLEANTGHMHFKTAHELQKEWRNKNE